MNQLPDSTLAKKGRTNQVLLDVNIQNNDDILPAFSLDLSDCLSDAQPVYMTIIRIYTNNTVQHLEVVKKQG